MRKMSTPPECKSTLHRWQTLLPAFSNVDIFTSVHGRGLRGKRDIVRGENVIVDIEVALFDGERTIPRDGNFGYCIGGTDSANFLAVALEFKGGNSTGCSYATRKRGGVQPSEDC